MENRPWLNNPRVYWNRDERHKVNVEVARLVPLNPLKSLWDIANMAQTNVLPRERRRKLYSCGISRINKEVQELKPVPAAAAPAPAPEPAEPPEPQIIEIEKPVHVPVELPVSEALIRATLPELMSEMGKRLGVFMSAIGNVESLQKMMSGFSTLPPPPPGSGRDFRSVDKPSLVSVPAPPAAAKKCRIAIVGLLKHQFDEVAKRVNGNAELLWVDKDLHRPAYPMRTEYVINQRHCRHGWTEAAKNHVGSERAFWVDGGISSVVQKVYDITSIQKKTVPAMPVAAHA